MYRYLNIPYGDAYEPFPDKPYSNKKRWTPATRWNPDTSVSRTSKSIDGTTWGPACLQTGRAKIEPKACLELPAGTPTAPGALPGSPDYIGAEDCLTLNVYTPSPPDDTSGQLKPVVVWIHGGNYMRGTANSCSFEGTLFASRQDVVVVTVNYRLGVLGFLGNFGDADSKMGNFGLRDQRLALEWVQENIESFGGDPERVTIWGESAGASSVGVHLASSGSQPYFKQAMMDSNHYGMRFATHEMAERRAAALIDGVLEESSEKASLCPGTLPCRDRCPLALTQEAKIQCLRECHSGKVLNDANRRTMQIPALLNQGLGGAQYWGPMVETAETTPPPRALMVEWQPIDSGLKTLDHPILVGTNGSEGANVKLGLAPGRTPPTAKTIYQGSMYAAFGILAPRRTLATGSSRRKSETRRRTLPHPCTRRSPHS